MRRFSSEGSLLDLDFLPWKRVALNSPHYGRSQDPGTYTPHLMDDELGERSPVLTPTILEPGASPGQAGKKELTKEQSISVENLSELQKQDKNYLGVCVINEGCRAYSDSQLAPGPQGSTESMERDDLPSPSTPSSSNPFSSKYQHRHHHHRAKLSAAKLHLKSLFGQVGQVSLSLHCRAASWQVLKKTYLLLCVYFFDIFSTIFGNFMSMFFRHLFNFFKTFYLFFCSGIL